MSTLRRLIGAIPCLLTLTWVLSGCGGGGPIGGGGAGALSYSTVWTTLAGPGPDGQSQKVRVFALDGTEVVPPTMIEKQAGQPRADILLNPGLYRVRCELWSGPSATGDLSGVTETLINVSAITRLDTQVGGTPSKVALAPPFATIQLPANQRFVGNARVPSGKLLFLAPAGLTFTATGSAGINSQGILTPLGPTSGQARVAFGNLQATANYTALAGNVTTGKWTVLVYMNAANDLNPFAAPNVNQMELVAGNPDVRFVVQWKEVSELPVGGTFSGTKRYLVRPDASSLVTSPIIQDLGSGVDMGSAQTLRDFIAWGKANYPAQRYCVVVWNHGNGWRPLLQQGDDPTRGVSKDDETGHSIGTSELDYALGPDKIDIVAWDASLMQMLEVAYQIRNKAFFVAGSEESPPGAGYPYDLVFERFRDTPLDSTANLSKGFVDGMLAVPGYALEKIEQSVLDTSKLPALAGAVDALGTELSANYVAFQPTIQAARNNAQAYSPTGSRIYRDLYDLCVKLEAGSGLPASTVAACQNVRAKILDAVIWEGHNGFSANSHGVSIDFSPQSVFLPIQANYGLLSFAADTAWDNWLAIAP